MMRLEDFKRWHWAVIGLLVGLGLAYVKGGMDPMEGPSKHRSIGQVDFERDLVRTTDSGQPRVRNLRVYPTPGGHFYVSGERMESGGRRQERDYRTFSYLAATPYRPEWNALPGGEPDPTILAYLDRLKDERQHIQYRYAWWNEPRKAYILWISGSVLLIGGLWPTLISLMIGAGLGRRSQTNEAEYDLSRFGQHPEEQEQSQNSPPVGQQDQDRLKEVEEELQRRLAESGAPGHLAPSAEAEPGLPDPVQKLEAGPIETATDQKPEEEKDYRGEFYPTVAHAPKQPRNDA